MALSFALGLALLPARALPFSVNLLGDYLGKANQVEGLPTSVAGAQLLYGIEASETGPSGWQETGDTDLFRTTFAVGHLIANVQLTSDQRPELSYLAMQAGDDYAVWDISGWNCWGSDSLLVVNDRLTSIHTIHIPFLGTLRIPLPDDITGLALYGPLVGESPGPGGGGSGGGLVLGGDVGAHPTRVPDGGSVFALLAVGVAAAAFMTRRAS